MICAWPLGCSRYFISGRSPKRFPWSGRKDKIELVKASDHGVVVTKSIHDATAVDRDLSELFLGHVLQVAKGVA